MKNEMISIVVIMIEMMCAMFFFHTFMRKENEHWKNRAWGVVILFVMIYLNIKFIKYLLPKAFLLKEIFNIIIMSVVTKIYFKDTYVKCLICSGMFQGLILIVDLFTYIVMITLFSSANMDGADTEGIGNLLIILGKMFLYICVLLIRRYLGNTAIKNISNLQWIQFCIFPVFTVGMICALIKTYQLEGRSDQIGFFYAMEFGLISMNVVVYYLIENISKREAEIYEKSLMKIQMDKTIEVYENLMDNYKNQKREMHEFNNKITCIATLLKEHHYKELEEYVDKIAAQAIEVVTVYRSNHMIVDAIINVKYKLMMEKNIIFVSWMNDLSELRMEDNDIVVLLSNLLNNAIEACEQCEYNRYIKLKFILDEESVILMVKNSYSKPVLQKDGKFMTSKKSNQENHGIGIKNIEDVVNKYHGTYVIDLNQHEFTFSITIQNNIQE